MRTQPAAILFLAAALAACSGDPPPQPAATPEAPVALADDLERRDVRFPCGDTECAAWLYLPDGAGRPPVVLLAHGFAGTRDAALPYFAESFARRGLAALVFDYRYFGASGGSPRQLVDPWRQLEDWAAALAFVRASPDLDGSRVALFGSSFGAGHALITAAREGGLRAVVGLAPLVDSRVEGEASFAGPLWAVRILFTAWADLVASAFGGSVSLPAIAPSGGFGMIVDDAAYGAFERLAPESASYRNEVLARSILTFDEYDPSPSAGEIEAPLLLVASRGDRFAPFAAAESLAARTRDGRLAEIPGDHFDVYSSPVRERAAELAGAFLAQHLLEPAEP
jgi:pimeloyl-ACP methyl ester carboxylesterase